ncbi:MAG: hypothetical protein JXB32_05020, partial [Deltaproteobacteria bacterium]|nr:hypothetical protein [Deltaproteobacteria bacterium]
SWGCDDDSSPAADDAAAGDADAHAEDADADAHAEDADADEGGATGTLNVLVLGPPVWPDYQWNPVEDALVAFDLPGGGRSETTTDAAGRATFDRFDWAAGAGAVTAGKNGLGLASEVGLDGTQGDVTLVLPDPDPRAGRVELTVSAVNMTDVSHPWEVMAVGVDQVYASGGGAFDLVIDVPPGTPLTLHAGEWEGWTLTADGLDNVIYSWVAQEVAPISGPATAEIDFAAPALPSTTVSGSFPLPADPDSPLRQRDAYVVVWTMIGPNPGRHFLPVATTGLGGPTHIGRSVDGDSVEYTVQYVTPPGAVGPVTRYTMETLGSSGGAPYSCVDVAGYPASGAQTFTHLEVPTVHAPTTVHALHDPVEWDLFDGGVTPTLHIRTTRVAVCDTDVWRVSAPTDATSLVVPQPPAGFDTVALLGTDLIRGRIGILADDPGDLQANYAESGCFLVQP